MDEIRNMFDNVAFDIIAVTETWLKPNVHFDNQVSMNGYSTLRHDRNRFDLKRGGGVMLYIRNPIITKSLFKSPKNSVVEYLFIELSNNVNEKMVFGVVYNPPKAQCLTVLTPILNDLVGIYDKVVITGDFNTNLLSIKKSVRDFTELLNSINLSNVSYVPTNHVGKNQSTLIDLTLTNSLSSILMYNQISGLSTHDLIYGAFNFDLNISLIPKTVLVRRMNRINVASLNLYASTLDWSAFMLDTDVDRQLNMFNNHIMQLLDEFAPEIPIVVNSEKVEFKFSSSLTCLHNLKNFYEKKWRRSRLGPDRNFYIAARKKFYKALKAERVAFDAKRFNHKLPPRILFRNLRENGMIGRDISFLDYDPDLLNEYFVGSSVENSHEAESSLDDSQMNLNLSFLDDSKEFYTASASDESDDNLYDSFYSAKGDTSFEGLYGVNQFSFRNVMPMEVLEACNNIKSNAIGTDFISIKFIKMILPVILPFLTYLLNCCLTKSVFPDKWKYARVVPIPKVTNPKKVEEFRPISILPALSKILEILMKNQMLEYLNVNELLGENQSGFRKGHSTATALSKVVEDLTVNIDDGKISILVLIDFSKAFDSIPHGVLLRNLRDRFRFSACAVSFIKSYLSMRRQKVVIGERESGDLICELGVPQGSILGPLLFSMFIDGISDVLNGTGFHLYADDLQVYESGFPNDMTACVERMTTTLARISLWAQKNCLYINANKTQSILISNMRSLTSFVIPPLFMNNTKIPYSNSVRNLGVIFDTKLNWEKHINSICSSVYGILSRLWPATTFLPTETRKRLVVALILPKIIYCAPVFAGAPKNAWRRLNLAFNSCARYIFKKRCRDRISGFTERILNCSLEKYICYLSCCFLFKVISTQIPPYLHNKIFFSNSKRTGTLKVPLGRTKPRSSSLLVLGVKRWNALSFYTRSSRSLSVFKRNCFRELTV
jgi:hypothetical protein